MTEAAYWRKLVGRLTLDPRQKSGNGRTASKAKPADAWHHSRDRSDVRSSQASAALLRLLSLVKDAGVCLTKPQRFAGKRILA